MESIAWNELFWKLKKSKLSFDLKILMKSNLYKPIKTEKETFLKMKNFR